MEKFVLEFERPIEELEIKIDELKRLSYGKDIDISGEIKKLEKKVTVGQIAAGVTHEVRTPLTSLGIIIQILMKEISDKLGSDSESYKSASQIQFEIDRINNILEEFVSFAKFPEPRFSDNNINLVIKEANDFISKSINGTNTTIKLLLQEDIPDFKFDAGQLRQVLINLSQNAIRSMKDAGSWK